METQQMNSETGTTQTGQAQQQMQQGYAGPQSSYQQNYNGPQSYYQQGGNQQNYSGQQSYYQQGGNSQQYNGQYQQGYNGQQVGGQYQPYDYRQNAGPFNVTTGTMDAPSGGLMVLAGFLPILGLILYLVWNSQKPIKARSVGKGALIGAGVWFVVILFLVILFLN